MTIFNNLPFDAQLEIFRYPIASRQFSIREVCKEWKRKAEECLKRHFITPLKRFNVRLKEPVDIAELAKNFDESQHSSLKAGMLLLKKISKAFSKYKVSPKQTAITTKEVEELESEAQKTLDTALIHMWSKVSAQISKKGCIPDSNTNANQIREWLKDPVNAEILETVQTLDLKFLISVLPPEIQSLKNLKQLDISHCNLKCLPEEIFQLPNLRWIISKFNTELSALDYESRGAFVIIN